MVIFIVFVQYLLKKYIALFLRVTFPVEKDSRKRKADEHCEKKELIVVPYQIPNRGPYPYNKPKMQAFYLFIFISLQSYTPAMIQYTCYDTIHML